MTGDEHLPVPQTIIHMTLIMHMKYKSKSYWLLEDLEDDKFCMLLIYQSFSTAVYSQLQELKCLPEAINSTSTSALVSGEGRTTLRVTKYSYIMGSSCHLDAFPKPCGNTVC